MTAGSVSADNDCAAADETASATVLTPESLQNGSLPNWALPIEYLPASGRPDQLMVLLHGWASDAQAMQPLAQALRERWPQAAVLVPQANEPADAGRRGMQWYSIEGLHVDGLWAARVAAMVVQLQTWVQAQQRRLGLAAPATTLAGFSQGAILSLALALHDHAICARVLSFGGCLVKPPNAAPRQTRFHLFHGSDDRRIPADRSSQAQQWLCALGAAVTLDLADGIGHLLHPTMIGQALQRLDAQSASLSR